MSLLRPTSSRCLAALLAAAAVAGCATTEGAATPRLELLTHAEFLARESGRTVSIDPQVFVVSPGAPAATGLQDIAHAEGLRNASPSDPLAARLFTAQGRPLDLTVGQWFFASGSVSLEPPVDGVQRLVVTMRRLKPAGAYSLLDRQLDREPVGAATDGGAPSNSFVADAAGNATVTIVARPGPTHDDALLLVYHSDGAAPGSPGIDTHLQLVVRVPG